MTSQAEPKSLTFTWFLKNISCHWEEKHAVIKSPTLEKSIPHELKFHLNFCPKGFKNDNCVDFYLCREEYSCEKIDCELALLSKNGSVLTSIKQKNCDRMVCFDNFKETNKIFVVERSAYLPNNKLTVRCRIWKSEGEFTEDIQWFARTRICIRREVFLWNIPNFSGLQSEEKCTYQIKSALDNKVLMSFKLLYHNEDLFTILLISENSKKIYFELHLSLLNDLDKAKKGIRKEFFFTESEKQKLMDLPFSKKDLLANKNVCLPNDVLSFRCDCTYSTGAMFEEIESVAYNCDGFGTSEPDDEENTLPVSKRVLGENLKYLFLDNILSDVKLKTRAKTFLAHKNILSARSPVFKAMFENEMREKLNECVDIEDLDSDTVCRMLQYVYTAEIEGLQWETACELYRAADKYEILALRDECSAYLKSNVSLSNACEALIFADAHQDDDLKSSVQNFIFDLDIMNSDKWKLLMETHLKLAADTMYLKIQRKQSESPPKFFLPLTSTNKFSFGAPPNPSTFNFGTEATLSTLKSNVPATSNFNFSGPATRSTLNSNVLATSTFSFGAPATPPKSIFGTPVGHTSSFHFGSMSFPTEKDKETSEKSETTE